MDFSAKAAEWKRATDAEAILRSLLRREGALDIAKWEHSLDHGLRTVAVDFRADTRARRKNLARDLAACWKLYEGLQEHVASIKGTTSERQAVSGLIAFATALKQSVRTLDRANGHFQTLPGLMALEFAVTALRERPAGSPGERKGIAALADAIAETIAEAKIDLVLGSPRHHLLTDISAQISTRLDEWEEEEEISLGRPLPEQLPTSGIFHDLPFGHIAAARAFIDFEHSDRSKHFIDSSVTWLKELGKQRNARSGGLNLRSIPTFSFAWAICNLVDGWKPKSSNRNEIAISKNSDGSFVQLLGLIASQRSAEDLKGNPFSSAAKRVERMYKNLPPNWCSVFAGRRDLATDWRPPAPKDTKEAVVERYGDLGGFRPDDVELDPDATY